MSAGRQGIAIVCAPGQGEPGPCPAGTVPTAEAVVLVDPSALPALEAASQPFDSMQAGQFFMFGLVSTLGFWLLVHGVGLVLRLVREA